MHGKNASQPVLFLILVNLLILAFSIQSVGASGTIYIRADGSIDPPTAPIHRSIDMYTFTDDISGSIIVEKDNIVVDGAGHTLQGTGSEIGIDLSGRTNVTIKNVIITTYDYAIYLSSSNNVTISGTNIADSSDGIWISNSSNNSISGNNITANVLEGIYILASSANSISGNNITANTFDGVYLFSSSNNSISGNNITDNGDGITSYYSSDNRILHNNFITNFEQAYSESSVDIWDDGYPSGGNYWNNYTGVDEKCGPSQDHIGSDGIGDTPYAIDGNNQDNYPLMNPWTPPAGHDVGVISVVPSKTVIGHGFGGNITVYGANKGEYTETFNVSIYANTTRFTSTALPLGSGSTTTIMFLWAPTNTSFPKGNYTIRAVANVVLGETNINDNNYTDSWIMVTTVGDLTGGSENPWDFVPDGVVDGSDLSIVAKCYGSWPGALQPMIWNANCDVNDDGVVDGGDLAIVARHFGEGA